MICPRCRSSQVLVEAVGNGNNRISCKSCHYANLVNPQGKQYLTSDSPSSDKTIRGAKINREYLLEGCLLHLLLIHKIFSSFL